MARRTLANRTYQRLTGDIQERAPRAIRIGSSALPAASLVLFRMLLLLLVSREHKLGNIKEDGERQRSEPFVELGGCHGFNERHKQID